MVSLATSGARSVAFSSAPRFDAITRVSVKANAKTAVRILFFPRGCRKARYARHLGIFGRPEISHARALGARRQLVSLRLRTPAAQLTHPFHRCGELWSRLPCSQCAR
ncbi:hypothetical protein TRVL_10399 [Trypanosoma vivax]|nr:hypothetical protein TRVL_10399 [Trypanosoma vivax]